MLYLFCDCLLTDSVRIFCVQGNGNESFGAAATVKVRNGVSLFLNFLLIVMVLCLDATTHDI